MSSIQIDGTHTSTKRGGEAVAYQGRKKSKTGNMIILTDNQGTPLSCSEPISGNHNDAFELVPGFKSMLPGIKSAGIATDGLFLNTDAGFDNSGFRSCCFENDINGNIDLNKRNGTNDGYLFEELLYKCRFVIERTNAWLDVMHSRLY